jgi:hypothetical protein
MQVQTIAERLLFATVRLEARSARNSNGAGTAFIFRQQRAGEAREYLVTNKHVIQDAQSIGATFHRCAGHGPHQTEVHRYTFPRAALAWTAHPDPAVDLAVTPLAPVEDEMTEAGMRIYHHAVDESLLPDADDLAACDAIEDVVFIGYPNGIWDRRHHLPIMRRGITATPVTHDFEGTPRFLIDAAVFGGSSGSPVFVYNRSGWTARDGTTHSGHRLLFVGIVGSVYYRSALNEVVDVPMPGNVRRLAKDREMLDLGVVFKARCVVEAIDAATAAT